MTAVYRTGTCLYRQASGGFPPRRWEDLPLLKAVDSGPLQGPPQTWPRQISRELGPRL
jgi:hypothetical protein